MTLAKLYARGDWVGFAMWYKELYEQADDLEQLRLARLLLSKYRRSEVLELIYGHP